MPFIVHGGKRICFVHIPKTGGTSVEQWMRKIDRLRFYSVGLPLVSKIVPQHYTARDLKELFSDDFFDYQFTIVRNPYERIESEYRQAYTIAKQGFFKDSPTFSQFIANNIPEARRNPFSRDNHMRPQVDFLDTGVKVFRFESGIENIISLVCEDLGLEAPVTVEHMYSTGDSDIPLKWSAQDRIMVNEYYKADFNMLKYTMLEPEVVERKTIA